MKRIKLIRLWAGIALIAILAILNGCSGGTASPGSTSAPGATAGVKEAEPPSSTPNSNEAKSNPSAAQASSAKEHHQKIKLYYTDEQAMELKQAEKEVSWEEEEGVYPAAFAALAETAEAPLLSLWEGQKINKIQLSSGMLTIDLKAKEWNEGSSVERLALLSLLSTMFQFPEVESIQLLIEGKKTETLGGHMEIQQPFTKSMLADL